MLEDEIPELLPELRPYQRRAAFWMVEREKALKESQGERERNQFHSPLCVPVDFLDTRSKMFFNPFRLGFLTGFQNITYTFLFIAQLMFGWFQFLSSPTTMFSFSLPLCLFNL